MADNVELDAGSGGATIKTFEDTNSVHWPAGVGVYLTSQANPDVVYVPIAAALSDDMTNPTTLLQGSCNMVFDGTTWDRLPGTTADGVLVNLGGNNDVTVTGTVDLGATDNAVLDSIVTALGGSLDVSAATVTVDATGQGDVPVTLDGESVAVTGTVTANLSATDNAVLDAIAASVAGTLTVGSHAVTNAGTFAVQVDAALPAGTNAIGKLAANDGVDIGDVTLNNTSIAVTSASALDVSAATVTVDGTVTANLGATDNAVLDSIDSAVNGTITVDGTGTFVTQSTAAGNVAHDAADSGNPVKVGGKAITSELAAVANADRTDFVADVHGRQIVSPYCNKEQAVSGTASATDTSNTAVLSAAGAGVKNYITSISIHNSSDTDTYVTIKDGTTAKLVVAAPAKGGAVLNLSVPLASTANTAINFASAASVSTMYVSAVGFTGA